MDIKWKNRIKVIGWILLFTFGVKGFLSGFYMLANESDYLKNDYFKTMQFEHQLNEFVEYLTMFELNELTKEEAKKAITVDQDEIDEHRFRYGNLSDQINNITYQYEDKIQNALKENQEEVANIYIAERDRKIEDITNNFKDDEHVREKIIKEKEQKIDEHFKQLENYRSQFLRYNALFTYYLKDNETGKVYTNLKMNNDESVEQLINEEKMLFIRTYPSDEYGYLSQNQSAYHQFNYDEQIENLYHSQKDKAYTGHIAISNSLAGSSSIMEEVKNYKQKQIVFLFLFLLSIIALLLSLYIYKKTRIILSIPTEKSLQYYNRIPLDIRVIGFLLTMSLLPAILTSGNFHYYFHHNVFYIVQDLFFLLVLSALFLYIAFFQSKLLFETMKDLESIKQQWRKSVVYSWFNFNRNMVTQLFSVKSIATQLLILLGLTGILFTLVIFVAIYEPYSIGPFLLILMGFCFFVLMFLLKKTAYLNLIITNVNNIVKGNLETDIPIKGKSVLASLASNINTLKHGVKTSQKEQAKSERLKTELITNVSHDLRTPLTSIITYTELLKGSEVSTDDRNAYIEIIDRKSKRLKVLIDDLFEASKMASGNIELVKEKVDLVQLLQQALAEYNETINQSTLQFRVTNPDTPVYAVVDGQKMWRVFDNLIGNILKYSLEHTRVYISVKNGQDYVEITFKNVTKYELGENIDELFERFKRGDTSRQTDGSGLGLAIAKSIIDLHQGQLDIDLDGDLFKVRITVRTEI